MEGQIVFSKAGRDKGRFMVVVRSGDKFIYVCDGKERPLARPKRKNVKHIAFTNTVIDSNSYLTDKSLRKALAVYKDSAKH